MTPRTPNATRTYTLFPYTARVRSERIGIALDRKMRRQGRVGPGLIDLLVDPDRIDPGLVGIGAQLAAGTLRKADDRRVGMQRLQSPHDIGIRRDHPLLILRGAEAARPAVEQLDRKSVG